MARWTESSFSNARLLNRYYIRVSKEAKTLPTNRKTLFYWKTALFAFLPLMRHSFLRLLFPTDMEKHFHVPSYNFIIIFFVFEMHLHFFRSEINLCYLSAGECSQVNKISSQSSCFCSFRVLQSMNILFHKNLWASLKVSRLRGSKSMLPPGLTKSAFPLLPWAWTVTTKNTSGKKKSLYVLLAGAI